MSRAPAARVVHVAIEFFSRLGFAGTSVRDPAGATQMSASNIYHYFGRKQGILAAAMEHITLELVRVLRAATASGRDPLARFRYLVRAHLRLIVDRPAEAGIYALDGEHLSVGLNGISRRAQREVLAVRLETLKGLRQLGYLEGREVAPAAFNIFGILNWSLRWYRERGALMAEEAIAEHGLLGPSDRTGVAGIPPGARARPLAEER